MAHGALSLDGEKATMSLTESAVNIIRDRILDLSVAPGSRIDERLLMERFNLSRTPAREALNRLAAEGLVEIQSNKGAFVRPLDIDHVKQLFDAYFTSERVNGHFCNTSHADLVADLERIRESYEQASAARDYLEVTRLNSAFHRRIALATGNEYYREFSARLHGQARRLSYFIYLSESHQTKRLDRHQRKIGAHHNAIIEMVRGGDNDGLVEIMTEHAQLFHDRIMRAIGATRGKMFVPMVPKK